MKLVDDMEFESFHDGASYIRHMNAPTHWAFAMEMKSLGFDFLNTHERDECFQGKTSIMMRKGVRNAVCTSKRLSAKTPVSLNKAE
jgi:hypothetical protein